MKYVDTISYFIILVAFSLVAITYDNLNWKVLSVALVLCAVIGLIFKMIIKSKIKNNPRVEEIDKLVGIIPIGIVFYGAAIYSLLNQGEFLPVHTSIMLLVIPPISLRYSFKTKKNI